MLRPNSLRILLLIRSDFLIFLLLWDMPLIIAVVLTALHIAIDVEEFSSHGDPATLGHISPISRCERIGFYLLLIVLVICIWRFLLSSLRTGSLWLLPVFLNKFPFLFWAESIVYSSRRSFLLLFKLDEVSLWSGSSIDLWIVILWHTNVHGFIWSVSSISTVLQESFPTSCRLILVTTNFHFNFFTLLILLFFLFNFLKIVQLVFFVVTLIIDVFFILYIQLSAL